MSPGQLDPEDPPHKHTDNEGSTTQPLAKAQEACVSSFATQAEVGTYGEEQETIPSIPEAHAKEEHEEGGDEIRLVNLLVVGQREEACDELEAACECIILQLDGHTLRLGIKVDLTEIVASFFQCSFKGRSIVRRYKALQQKELLISKALPLESRTAEGKAVLQ